MSAFETKAFFPQKRRGLPNKNKKYAQEMSLQSSCSLTPFDFGGKTPTICQSMDLKLIFRCFQCSSTCDTLTSQSGEARLSHG